MHCYSYAEHTRLDLP